MQLTNEQIADEIAAITAKLNADTRPTRPEDPNDPRAVTRSIFQDRPSLDEQGRQKFDHRTGEPRTESVMVGTSVELPEAEAIREERSLLKFRRRNLRRELAARERATFDPNEPTRSLEVLDAEIQKVGKERAELLAAGRELQRERDRAVLRDELDDMPADKREALRQMLGPAAIASSAKVGTPGS